MGWVNLRLNFRSKGYVSRQYLIIYEPLDWEWLYYNFATGRFHTKKLVADFIRLKLNFIQNKNKKSESPFEGLTGNVRTPSIARWKARGRLTIRRNRN